MKLGSPLISIIVPVYNVQDYIGKCLESLSKQTYDNIEVLVIDDGSTDRSGEICDSFGQNDERIKVIHKKNGGLSSARNFGFKKAKGDFVCFIDGDDYVAKDFVEKLYFACKENDAEIAICGFNNKIPKKEILSGKEATSRLLIKQENIEIVAWNKIYKKNLFIDNKIEYPEGKKHEDSLTTYKLLSRAKRIIYISKSLYTYVEREDSIMHQQKEEERLKIRELAAREAIGYFKDNPELLSAAKVSLLLAKYAFLDFAISGKIDKKYGRDAIRWIRKNEPEYRNNKFLTKKLKLYNALNMKFNGKPYVAFRKIRHE